MKTLEEIFKQHTGPAIHRFNHMILIYDELFSRYRGEEVTFLEVGIATGGSLQMWKEYFGAKAKIYGVDISDVAKVHNKVEDDQITIMLGDQGNKNFMEEAGERIGKIDIIIDDGSHVSKDQIKTFETMFPYLNDNGIYTIEDIHCSYRSTFGGGFKKPDTIVEYMKKFIDHFHPAEIPEDLLEEPPPFLDSLYSVRMFRNLIVVDKWSGSYLVGSPLMTGLGTTPDVFHKITGGRFS